jgi:hypothetical protein
MAAALARRGVGAVRHPGRLPGVGVAPAMLRTSPALRYGFPLRLLISASMAALTSRHDKPLSRSRRTRWLSAELPRSGGEGLAAELFDAV